VSPGTETKDSDYIFIRFVLGNMPEGLVGLLLAAILMAAMSSTASELSSLGSTTFVDLYKRLYDRDVNDKRAVLVTQGFTVFWGLLAVAFASFAALLDNLIQAVNILGSIFYGVILGIFLVAFFLPKIRGTAVFYGAILGQIGVVTLFFASDIGFLWFNLIGCVLVMGFASVFQLFDSSSTPRSTS
jgi:Na+/proline symporter